MIFCETWRPKHIKTLKVDEEKHFVKPSPLDFGPRPPESVIRYSGESFWMPWRQTHKMFESLSIAPLKSKKRHSTDTWSSSNVHTNTAAHLGKRTHLWFIKWPVVRLPGTNSKGRWGTAFCKTFTPRIVHHKCMQQQQCTNTAAHLGNRHAFVVYKMNFC